MAVVAVSASCLSGEDVDDNGTGHGSTLRWPVFLEAVDVNADGWDDLVAVAPGLKTTEVLIRRPGTHEFERRVATSPFHDSSGCGPHMLVSGRFRGMERPAIVVADSCGWWWFQADLQGHPLRSEVASRLGLFLGTAVDADGLSSLVAANREEIALLDSPIQPTLRFLRSALVPENHDLIVASSDSPIPSHSPDVMMFQVLGADDAAAFLEFGGVGGGDGRRLKQASADGFLKPFSTFDRLTQMPGCQGTWMSLAGFLGSHGRTPRYVAGLAFNEGVFRVVQVGSAPEEPVAFVVSSGRVPTRIWAFSRTHLTVHEQADATCSSWRVLASAPHRVRFNSPWRLANADTGDDVMVGVELRRPDGSDIVLYDGLELSLFDFDGTVAAVTEVEVVVNVGRADRIF